MAVFGSLRLLLLLHPAVLEPDLDLPVAQPGKSVEFFALLFRDVLVRTEGAFQDVRLASVICHSAALLALLA